LARHGFSSQYEHNQFLERTVLVPYNEYFSVILVVRYASIKSDIIVQL